MREIKFRAWDIESPMMLTWEEIQLDWESEGYSRAIFANDHYRVMQFTGLKDKNGKEIYEGDILSYDTNYIPYKCVIEWNVELGSCGCCYEHCGSVGFVGEILPGSKYDYSGKASGYHEMEVIGNIWENPELANGVRG